MAIQLMEWNNFWERLDSPIPDFENLIVVDYGCGFGYDSLFALQKGAKHVYCLEVSPARLKNAQELHVSHGFENATYIDNSNVGGLPAKIREEVDVIFCRDVMEHVPQPLHVLDSMHRITKPGGEIYIGFSPLYRSPYGSHFKNQCKIPWIHLIFSEETILTVFKERFGMPRSFNSFQEIEGSGVNKLSYYAYKKMLDRFTWSRENDLANRFPKRPLLAKTLDLLLKITPSQKAKELFIINLRKLPAACTAAVDDNKNAETLVGLS